MSCRTPSLKPVPYHTAVLASTVCQMRHCSHVPCSALYSTVMYCFNGLCLRGVRRSSRLLKNKACECPKKCYCTLLRNMTQRSHLFCIGAIPNTRSVCEYCALLCAVVPTVLYCTVLSILCRTVLCYYTYHNVILYFTELYLFSGTRPVLLYSKNRPYSKGRRRL